MLVDNLSIYLWHIYIKGETGILQHSASQLLLTPSYT